MPRFSWTVQIGRWSGIPIQIHLFLLLTLACIFGLEWHFVRAHPTVHSLGIAACGVLFLSVLAHEMAHAFTAVCLGGRVREIVLTPWGGDSHIEIANVPSIRMAVASAGPFVNFIFCLMGAFILIAAGQEPLVDLVNPTMQFTIVGVEMDMLLVKLATWINFQLLFINLLPVYPFDAGSFLRSAFIRWRPMSTQLWRETVLLGLGIATGLMCFVAAFLLRDYNVGLVQPTWCAFVCCGVIAIFLARYSFHHEMEQEAFPASETSVKWVDGPEYEEELDDYQDDPKAPHFLTNSEEDLISRWLEEHKSSSELVERSIEQDEEKRVDAILEKLHHQGIDALSEEERSFLERISRQYRRRRELRS